MDEVNIILLCSGVIVSVIIGWYYSDKVSYQTFCIMRGYTPVSGFEDI
jgi:hypothetical protein